jgi:hypothetical protein
VTHLFYYHDYLAIASPPGCGREHFAALVEIARQQEERARKVAEVKAVPRLDATPAKPRRQRNPRKPSINR